MIRIENAQIVGFDPAIRGMRNPMNSWAKSDTVGACAENNNISDIGPNDLELMQKLANAGPVHAKYRRMITVYVDITAPLYWWKEFDTYKVGTVGNSCSTMHKIQAKKFELDDFSNEHLDTKCDTFPLTPISTLCDTIIMLNAARQKFNETQDKRYWWYMIQLLPSSYNQRRTIMLNYEVLSHIYPDRKDHKLDEWHDFCHWIESLPYSELVTAKKIGASTKEI